MTNPARTDLERLLDLPDLIAAQERTILGMKADRDRVDRSLKAIEARLRLSGQVRSEKNAEDRAAALVLACEDHPQWCGQTERRATLTATIRSHEAQRDHLRRERDGLLTKLQHNFVTRFEECLKNRDFNTAIATGLLA